MEEVLVFLMKDVSDSMGRVGLGVDAGGDAGGLVRRLVNSFLTILGQFLVVSQNVCPF